MRKSVAIATVLVMNMALAACGGHKDAGQGEESAAEVAASPDTPVSSDTPASEAGGIAKPAAFAQCQSCHSVEPDKHLIGPSLAGIYGTPAGDIEGYNFSPAMRQSGIVWDDKTLDAYIKAPREVVPGTKMTYPGLKDDARRAEVVAYLKALSQSAASKPKAPEAKTAGT